MRGVSKAGRGDGRDFGGGCVGGAGGVSAGRGFADDWAATVAMVTGACPWAWTVKAWATGLTAATVPFEPGRSPWAATKERKAGS